MSMKTKRRTLDIQQDQENPLIDNDIEFRLLPELLQIILTKAALVQMYSKHAVKRQRDKSIFIGLASVDFRWWCSVKKYNLRNKILHHSKVYFQRFIKLRSTIVRNNRNFLKEVIDPDKIIFPLKSCDCLTGDQVTFLTRLRNNKEKNHELLSMLQDSSSQKYSKFVDCLFMTNQIPAALVLERGGDVAKVHISNGKTTKTNLFEMKLIERMHRMQTENTLLFNDLLNTSADKRLNGVCLLHAKQNKGIELLFWCKTESSLSQLKSLSDDDFREIIQQMYQRLIPERCTSLEPQLIQMDCTSSGDFAERRLFVKDVKKSHSLSVSGCSQCVTSLADKIYVAQGKEIFIFHDKHPFHSLKSIEFTETVSPISIASCSISKCLYLSAIVIINSSPFRRVYKVEPEFDNRISNWYDGFAFYPISVTSRGDVLDFQSGSEGSVLRIFTPEGTVKRKISMARGHRLTFYIQIMECDIGIVHADYIQEIMPDIVALIFSKPLLSEVSRPRCIVIMRLDQNGTILRYIECNQLIVGFSSFRYGDLLLGVSGNAIIARLNSLNKIHDTDLVYLESGIDLSVSEVLQLCVLESKVNQNRFATDEMIRSIHFASDQKDVDFESENDKKLNEMLDNLILESTVERNQLTMAQRMYSILYASKQENVHSEYGNVEKESEMLQHWTLESTVERNLLTTDVKMYCISFAADQKQLFVRHRNRLDIYKLIYEDEVYDT